MIGSYNVNSFVKLTVFLYLQIQNRMNTFRIMLDLGHVSCAWKTKTGEATQYILMLVSNHLNIVPVFLGIVWLTVHSAEVVLF